MAIIINFIIKAMSEKKNDDNSNNNDFVVAAQEEIFTMSEELESWE